MARNRDLAHGWMPHPNHAFGGLSPIGLIEKRGMLGMYIFRSFLYQ
ncbi:DUF2384 domain-containing protein [Microbulbifer sp. YPW1]|nr:DUF2384 domain-containing protein [Microbulbifer sp. YPW1]